MNTFSHRPYGIRLHSFAIGLLSFAFTTASILVHHTPALA
jgi:hypothetical protein